MTHKDDISKSLIECLKEVAGLLEHAKGVALKQQKGLVDNDAEMIVLTAKAQEEVLRRINETDQRAAALGSELLEAAGVEIDSVGSDDVADAAGYPYTGMIKLEMERISQLADEVQHENQVCQALLKNGLDIIACCFRTLANDPGPTSYSRTANMNGSQASVLSLDLRA